MNFLQLAQRARAESGTSRNTLNTPVTVVGQVGRLGMLVNWVASCAVEIELEQCWDFMWEEASVVIPAGTSKSVGQNVVHRRYDKDRARTSNGFMEYLPWADFSLVYRTIEAGAIGQLPSVWTIDPQNQVRVSMTVAANVTLTMPRYKMPVKMAVDTDEPAIPEDHQMAIVWRAVELYAQDQEAGVRIATARENWSKLHQSMMRNFLPTIVEGQPLA